MRFDNQYGSIRPVEESESKIATNRRRPPRFTKAVCFAMTAIVSLLLITEPVRAQSQLLGNISVEDNRVSTSTTFNFELISTSETVASNDYLLIKLPSELDSVFNKSGNPTC